MRPRAERAAGVLMIGTCALFVAMDAIAKALGHDYPVAQIVWARYAFHLGALFVLLALTGQLARVARTRRLGLQLARAGLMLVSTALYFLALRFIPLAVATALAFISPLLVTVLAASLLRERVERRTWAAVALGFVGAIVIIRRGLGEVHWAMLLPLIVAFTRALYALATRALGSSDPPYTTLFYTAAFGSVATSLWLPFAWRTPDAIGLVLMATLGLLGGVSHFLLVRAYMQAPSSMLAPFSYSELAWALAFGIIAFGELPDMISLLGAAIIALSGLSMLRAGKA